ncbi:sugar transferase [Sphingomonas sp. 22R3R2A-7]|uniref:sugar transferase n=1 Tax=Sphingomonas sp. 22R3R2A-7 TaxID=3050230 RepID=UPI002FE08906
MHKHCSRGKSAMYHPAALKPSSAMPPVKIFGMTSRYGAARLFDISVALTALLFFSPLMILIAITIYVRDPGPILFAQRRIGHRGRKFGCFKFRSMVVDAEARLAELLASDPAAQAEWNRDHKLRDDPRITLIGSVLRKSSLDELPQLLNVLRGDMSIVGPRPIVDAEVTRYGRYFAHYCYVRPGITGLWQVSGRNDVSYRRRVAFDVMYSRRRSMILDIRIIAMTVPSVLLARGSY